MNCIVCKKSISGNENIITTKCAFNGETLHRYRCPSCSAIYGNKRMLELSSFDLEKEYKDHYSAHGPEVNNTSLEISLLKALSPKPGETYINWGAGAGWNETKAWATSNSYNLINYDILNKESIKPCSGIISNNFIEHIQDPIDEFSLMNSVLSEGDFMIHATPCWSYCVERTRFHVLFLEGTSLNVLCEKTGFIQVENMPLPRYPYSKYPNQASNIKLFRKTKEILDK